jgi:hypothetical protein
MKSTLFTIVVALSLFAAAQISDHPGVAAPAPSQPTALAPNLNVIFHGLFAFVVWSDHIEVLAPQVDDHAYKAGSWGNEVRLKEGKIYELTGVRPASAVPAIDPTTNVVLDKVDNIKREQSNLFCSIKFPLPAAIKSLRRLSAADSSKMFGGNAAAHLQCRQVPLLEVFVYPIDSLKNLSLGNDLPWQPSMNGDKTVNLHVWAEPEAMLSPMPGAHSMKAFNQLMALFPDLDLKLNSSGKAPPEAQTNIRGMSVVEQKTLRERSPVITVVPANKAKGPSGGGAEVTTCLPLIIRNDKP